MKTLRTMFATCLAGLALLVPAAVPPAAQAGPGHGQPQPVARSYVLYYRDNYVDLDGRFRTSPWVVYNTYNNPQTVQAVAVWLRSNWGYETYIWSY